MNSKKTILNITRLTIFLGIIASVFILQNRELQVFAYTGITYVTEAAVGTDENQATEAETQTNEQTQTNESPVVQVESAAIDGSYVAFKDSKEVVDPATTPGNVANVGDAGVWDQLAACESGGNWGTNSGNGYYGGVQFSKPTWDTAAGAVGVSAEYPHLASKADQIKAATWLQQQSGWGQWPACAAKLGLI